MDRIIKRGDIYYAELNPVIGSEQGGTRPVLIISNDIGNRHSPTVIIAAITSRVQTKAKLPTHTAVKDFEGLDKDSIVLLEQIRTVDKKRLKQHMDQELSDQLNKLQEEQGQLIELSENQENTGTLLREFGKVLGSGEILESFDRVVFESVVEKIIIGGYNDEGVEEPLKITFVYKTGIHSNFNGKDFKPKRKNAVAVHNDAELCSYTSDEDKKLCLHSSSDTCGMCSIVEKD